MAVVAHALTTLAKVKLYLNISDTTNDTLLEQLIDNITEFVEGQLGGRRIKETVRTNEEHDGGEQDIFLDHWPVKETPALTAEFRTGPISNPTFQDFTADSFIVYPKGGFVHFFARTPGGETIGVPGSFGKGSRNLRFTYTAGFAAIPDDLELIAKQLVAKVFQRRTAQGIKSEAVEGSKIEYNVSDIVKDDLSESQQAVLKRYRRYHVGENF